MDMSPELLEAALELDPNDERLLRYKSLLETRERDDSGP